MGAGRRGGGPEPRPCVSDRGDVSLCGAAASWPRMSQACHCELSQHFSATTKRPKRITKLGTSVANHHGKFPTPVFSPLGKQIWRLTSRVNTVCPLQLPVPPARRPPPHLHMRLRARHDALPARQEERYRSHGLLLEVCPRGRAAESLREHMLRCHGRTCSRCPRRDELPTDTA